jgi:diphthamide biosynthesis enzyme Dph1/Dph2-like protein
MTIIDHLKKLISAAGKKSYTFVMGKLNVAKMANFMEIDCYVLVACPENSLIDSKVNKVMCVYRIRIVFLSSLQLGILPTNSYAI